MSDIVIKKANANDIDVIANLYHETIDYLNAQGLKQWNKPVYPTRQTALDALLSNSLYYCLCNDNLVGTFVLNEEQADQYKKLNWKYNSGKQLIIHTLITKPCERGKGIAKTMMQFIVAHAKNNNYNSIRLDVFPENKAAVILYSSFGFEFKEAGHEWYDCYEKLIT